MTNPLSDGQPTLLTREGCAALADFYRDRLLRNTMAFWFPRCLDRHNGGFFHCLDRDGTVVDTDKSVWAQGRMTWMLLTLHNTIEPRAEWLQWAESGLRFLERHGFDGDGRMFFHVAADGRPIRKRRYAYSESFAAIAFAAWARASGDGRAAERAGQLYQQFWDWNTLPGRMPAKYTGERPLIGLAVPMISLVTAQELRSNLGTNPVWEDRIDQVIERIESHFVKPDLRVVMESVTPAGEISDHFDGRLLNPGHAIEAAWFILREADHRQDSQLCQLGCKILDWMWERGWDREHGGIFYFRDVDDKPVQEYWHDMKFWWPHDEAIIATLYAWKLTGQQRYARWHQSVHDWSYRHFADPEHGEWFGYLHRDGRRSVSLKGNLWKSCFHHPRMEWMCSQLLLAPGLD